LRQLPASISSVAAEAEFSAETPGMSVLTPSAPPADKPEGETRLRFVWHVATAIGVSVVQQFIGLLRQVMIAAFFGLSREFDGYIVAYGLVTMVVFNLSGVFDTVAVSRLVQIRESDGDQAFWRASNRLLLHGFAVGALFAACFEALLWLAMPILAGGFTPDERAFVLHVGWFFIPWIVIVVPYYALSAHLKALWKFPWVFAAEVLAMVVSIVVLWVNHAAVLSLPLAYAAGYFAAAGLLLARRGLRTVSDAVRIPGFMTGMTNQYAAIQVGTVGGFADRYFQSFLMVGGISALGYVGLIVNSISSLLTFREIYVVPLATEEGREQKLERVLKGLVLVSIPCALFLVVYAEPIVSVLLQRGKFTSEAAATTASVMRIVALSLFVSTLAAPLERMFQILGRLTLTQIRYGVALAGTFVFQYLFVFYLGMDVQGVAWGWFCNGIFVLLFVIAMVRRCGVVIRWRGVFAKAAFAIVVAGLAAGISWPLASRFTGLIELAVGGGLDGIVIASGYFLVRKRLRLIIG
jgi:putative peptidoglycan lipid II flippase